MRLSQKAFLPKICICLFMLQRVNPLVHIVQVLEPTDSPVGAIKKKRVFRLLRKPYPCAIKKNIFIKMLN
jgi:hypothetical protein